MAKFAIAKQLAGKKIVTNSGDELGKLVDIMINELSGKMELLVLEPSPDSPVAMRLPKQGANALVPYSAVLAVSDYIVVDAKSLSQ